MLAYKLRSVKDVLSGDSNDLWKIEEESSNWDTGTFDEWRGLPAELEPSAGHSEIFSRLAFGPRTSVGLVALMAVDHDFELWVIDTADFCAMWLLKNILVGGVCENVDQFLSFNYLVNVGLA